MTAPTPSVITVRLDGVDLDRWIWVPHAWPYEGFTDPRGWADAAAKRVARRSGFAFVKRTALRDDLIDVHAILYVERDSQKGIVIGKGGARLREVGTAARIQIEKLLGTKVYLDLRVKIAKNWQRDPKQLGKLGF